MPPNDKLDLLRDWRQEIDLLFEGKPRSAIGKALIVPVSDYGLPKAEFLAMIEGMEMDAAGPIVAPSREQLSRYTRCVAGSVGLLSMRIFGAWQGDVSSRFALALADALQLTNILRDVEEDAENGRIYLPDWALTEAGVAAIPGTISTAPGLATARAAVAVTASENFQTARSLIPQHGRRNLVPALAMLGVYQGYFDRLEQANWSPSRPIKISKVGKAWLGLRAVLFAGPTT
jgi:phytoene synthase